MLRFLILSGYFELVMYLQVSGKLNQYINIHYSYLAYISMALSFILALVQLIVWMKQMKVHSHLSGRVAKGTSIVLLAFPVLTGLLVPTVTLDANTVSAKGYHFPLAAGSDPNQANQEGTTTQYLRPDTSSYFTSSAYEKEMTKELAKYKGCETIQIDCKAHNCTYNEKCKCTAAAIDVAGSGAKVCSETKCDTFECQC